ncbi:MAG: NUDIX hydrolase [Proteobacteria bacterium]|nr:NUDIX hydrolase [Pseudomonadota bacterium]
MRKPHQPSSREPDREPRAQFAALPWRLDPGGHVEVLLITSRETHRWVIPKGWPMKGKKAARCAAREAFEEAGVLGQVAKRPSGDYAYEKRLKNGRLQKVRVQVFPLRVDYEAQSFPEAGQRERLWLPAAEAARKVDEPELMVLLATFSPQAR